MKGAAANLGMQALRDAAERLESACRNGERTDAPLREVIDRLDTVLAGLNALAA